MIGLELLRKKWLQILTFNKHSENYVLMSFVFINVHLSTIKKNMIISWDECETWFVT